MVYSDLPKHRGKGEGRDLGLGFEGVRFLLDLQSTQIKGGALWHLVLDQVPWKMTKID